MKRRYYPRPGKRLIFRRFRIDPKTGQVLDAVLFGYRAWPIWVKE
jgi:hypothetical protein